MARRRVVPDGNALVQAMTKAEMFADAMIDGGHSLTEVMDNLRLVLIKRALERTRSRSFPQGCVTRAAKLLKTHTNVVRVRLNESHVFFDRHGLGRKSS